MTENWKYINNIFHTISPIKITESRCLKLDTTGWSIITDYYLESVKSFKYRGKFTSAAVIRIADKSGEVTCVIKGATVGLLFGLTKDQWRDVEQLSENGGDLFFRYFKDGLNYSFNLEQKMYYYFCLTRQRHDVLAAVFTRKVNSRNINKSDPLLQIVELRKCNDTIMGLYQEYLRGS